MYARARAAGVYFRTDLVVHGDSSGGVEYDFEIAPGGDPRDIRLRITGSAPVRLQKDGSLTLDSTAPGAAGLLRQRAPFAYQYDHGQKGLRQPVAVRFVRRGKHDFGFVLGAYDRSRPLVIDPTVEYTLLTCAIAGGPGGDSVARGVAVDLAGNVYVAGSTASPNFPTLNPHQPVLGGMSDAFVMKLDPSGQMLIYATYFGGSLDDFASSVAVTSAGEALVGGWTLSLSDFPVQSAYQPFYGGGTVDGDGFVFKLDAPGSGPVFSTFLGGAGEDRVNGVATDVAGNAYAAGTTASMNFPVTSALQGSCGGGCAQSDAFVAKLNPLGAITYATYLGGGGAEQALAIGADAAGLAYVAGGTTSGDFPFTASALQTAPAGGEDAFLAIYRADGAALTGATYLGGTLDDRATSVAPDGAGNAYVGGWTDSGDFPLHRSIQGVNAGMRDGFMSELDAAVGAFVNISDYIGGTDDDVVNGVALGPGGTLYLVGGARSLYLPFSYAFQPFRTGGALAEDAFVAMFEPVGPGITWGSFLGGLGPDFAYAVAAGADGRAWFAGLDDAADFPQRGKQYKTGVFRNDAFIASAGVEFAAISAQALLPTVAAGQPIDLEYVIANVSFVPINALTAIIDLGASCLDTTGVSIASVIADAPVTVTWTPPVLQVAFTNPFAIDEIRYFTVSDVKAGPTHTARCDVPSQCLKKFDTAG